MTQLFTDCMVDIETTGTSPDRGAILQISAVKFNLAERKVCHKFFDKCLSIPPHRGWDEDTRAWWNRQKPATLKEIMARQEPYRDVVQQFAQWAYQTPSLRFWSKPTTFDYMFVASYMKDENLFNPFHYRKATDLRSYLDGMYAPEGLKDGFESEVEFTGEAHNALADTLHQLKVLFHYVDKHEGKLNDAV